MEVNDLFSFLDEATSKTNTLLQQARSEGKIEDWRKKFLEDFSRQAMEQFSQINLTDEQKQELQQRTQKATTSTVTQMQGRGLSEGEVAPLAEKIGGERLTDRIAMLNKYGREVRGGMALDAANILLRGEKLDAKVAQKEQQIMLDTMAKWDQLNLRESLGLSALEIENAYRMGQIDNRQMALGLERVATLLGFQVQREEIAAQLDALEAENKARWNQTIMSGASTIIKLGFLLF